MRPRSASAGSAGWAACGAAASRFRPARPPRRPWRTSWLEADHRGLAHDGDDVVVGVRHGDLAEDEGHGAGLARLLVDVRDAPAAEIGAAGPDGLEVLELLLAMQQPADVHAEIPQEGARVGPLVAEGDGEGGRGDDVPPRPGLGDLVVQIEGREVADGAGGLLDLAPLDGDGVGGGLFALHGRVDLDSHQALVLLIARARNFSRLGTTKRS